MKRFSSLSARSSLISKITKVGVLAAAVAAVGVGFVDRPADAAIISWSPTAGSTSWTAGGNWIGATAPAGNTTGDVALFNQTSYTNLPTLTGNQSISGIQFGDGVTSTVATALGGGANFYVVGGRGITVTANSGAVTFNAGVRTNDVQVWANNSSSLLTFAGPVENSTNTNQLTIGGTGSGNIVFSGGFTSTSQQIIFSKSGGTTTIQTGTASFGTGGIMVTSGASAVSIASNTTLTGAQNWTNNSSNLLTVGGTFVTGNNVWGMFGSNGYSFTNNMTTGTAVTTISNTAGGVSISGTTLTSGTGGFNVGNLGSGLSISSAVTLSGVQTWVNNSGSNFAVTGGITGTNVTLTLSGQGNFNLGNVIALGTGGLTKTGAGTTTLNGSAVNTYTGTTTVNGGTLTVDFANLAGAANLINSGGALVLGGGKLNLIALNNTATSQTLGNTTISANVGNATIQLNNTGTSTMTLVLGSLTTNNGAGLNIIPAASGTSTITTTTNKVVADGSYGSRIVWNGSSTNADWVTTASGASPYTLSQFSAYAAFVGTGGVNTSNYLLTDSGTVTATETFNSLKITTTTTAQSLVLNAGSNLTLNNGGMIFAGANDYTISSLGGNLVGNTEYVFQTYSTGALTISAPLTSTLPLTKNGPGKLILTSTSNAFNGSVSINGGILAAGANVNLGVQATGAAININGGTLQATASFGLYNVTAGTNSRAINLGPTGGTIDTQGFSLSVSGTIGSTGSLTKIGSGTLILTTSVANYSGGFTFLKEGTIQSNISGGLPSATTLVMGGSGTSGTLTLLNNQTLSGIQVASLATAANQIIKADGAATLTFTGNNAPNSQISNFGGQLQNGTNTLSLTVNTGTLSLSGTSSNYSGNTLVNVATLNINSNTAIGTSMLRVTDNNSVIDATNGNITLANNNNFGNVTTPQTTWFVFGGTNSLSFGSGVFYTATGLADPRVTMNGLASSTLSFGSWTNGYTGGTNTTLSVVGAGHTLNLGGIQLSTNATARSVTFANTGNVNITGAIVEGGGAVGGFINHNGTGTVTVSSTSSIFAGAVQTNNNVTATISTVVSNNGILEVAASSVPTSGTVTSGPVGLAGLRLNGGTLSASSGSIALANSFYTGNQNNSIIGSSDITFNGAHIWEGANTLTVNNSGLTTLAGGIHVRDASTTGARTVTYAGSGNILVSGVVINGSSGSAGTIKYNGTGIFTLSNTNNAYTGNTTVGQGTMILGGNAPVSANGVLGNSNGTVTIGGEGLTGPVALLANGAYTIARNIQEAGATNSSFTIGGNNTTGIATFSGTFTPTANTFLTSAAGGEVDFTNTVGGGAFNFTIIGGGKVLLSGTNTYTGTTTVDNGTLLVGANAPSAAVGALGNAATAVTLGTANTTTNNSSVALLTNGAFTVGRAVTIANQATTGGYTLGGNAAAASTFSGAITLNQAVKLSQVAGGTVTFSNAISGAVPIVIVGGGSVGLSGTSSYSGSTTVENGSLLIGANAPSGSNGALGNATSDVVLGTAATTTGNFSTAILTNGAVTVGRGITVANQATSGIYTIGGNADASSTFAGAISLNKNASFTQVTTTGANKLNFTGGISAASGTPTLTFSGPGAISVATTGITDGSGVVSAIVSGGNVEFAATNTYSGTTQVTGGKLRVNGSIGASSAVSVSSGATIGGNGTINGTLNIASGGHVAPGNSIGTLNTAELTYASGSILDYEFGTGTPSAATSIADLTSVTGNLNFVAGAGTMTINILDNAGANGQGVLGNGVYKLFTFTGSLANFAGGVSGAGTFTVGTTPLGGSTIYTFSNVGNDILLSITNPVTSWTGQIGGVNGNPDSSWNTGTSTNFANGVSPTSTPTAFTNTTDVTFDDVNATDGSAITNYSVAVATGGVSPGVVTVNATGDYTFSSDDASGISSAASIVKKNTGRLFLTGANTLSGSIAIQAGAIRVSNSGALGSTSGVTVSSGAALELIGGVSASAGLSLNGAGVTASPAGALESVSGNNTYSGAITLAGAATIESTNSGDLLTISGGINNNGNLLTITGAGDTLIQTGAVTGAGGLTKTGTGTLTITSTNSFTGVTTISNGIVNVATIANAGTNQPLGKTSLAIGASGKLNYTGAADASTSLPIAGTAGGILNVTDSTARTLTLSGVVSGGLTLLATNANHNFVLSNTANTFSTLTVGNNGANAPTLKVALATNLPATATNITLNNATFGPTAGMTIPNTVTFTVGTGGATFGGTATTTYNSAFTGSGTATFATSFVARGQANNAGYTGVMNLTAANQDYDSNFFGNASTINYNNAQNGFWNNVSGPNTGAFVSASNWNFTAAGATHYTNGGAVMNFTFSGAMNGGTSAQNWGFTAWGNSNWLSFNLTGTTDNTNFSLRTHGPTTLSKTSSSTVSAIGGTGALTIDTGDTVSLAGSGDYQLADTATLNFIATSSILNLAGKNVRLDKVTGAGVIRNDTAATTGTVYFGVNNAATTGGVVTFGGTISSGTGTTALSKEGTGTLILSAVNTYAGATAINNGKLSIATTGTINSTSGISIGAGEFNYNSTTALTPAVSFSGTGGTLSGTGTISNSVTITAGNTLAPGNSPGTITFGTDLTLAGNTIMEISGNAAANTYDKVIVTGVLTYGGTLTIPTLLADPTNPINHIYTLFSFGSQTGDFSSVILPTAPTGFAWHDFGGSDYFDNASGAVQLDVTTSAATLALTPANGTSRTIGETVVIANTANLPSSDSLTVSALSISGNYNGNFTAAGISNGTIGSGSNQTGTIAIAAGSTNNRLNGAKITGSLNFNVAGTTVPAGGDPSGAKSYPLTASVSGNTVAVAGNGTTFGTTQTALVVSGDTLAGLSTTESDSMGTTLTLRDSTALGADSTVSVRWRERSAFEIFPTNSTPPLPVDIKGLISDVAEITLTVAPSAYVVEMSYDDSSIGDGINEVNLFSHGQLYLAHMTGELLGADTGNGHPEDSWQNATLDTTNPQSIGFLRGYQASDLSTIGSWGVDTVNNVAWTVVDGTVQGQFGVVPEPASLGLLAIGAMGLLTRRRR